MPESPKTVVSGASKQERKINLEIGKEYVIGPSSEHDGRRATLVELVPYHPDKPEDLVAKVSFTDDHRFGRVELGDLWEVGQIPEKPKKIEKSMPAASIPQPQWNSQPNRSYSNRRSSNTQRYRP